jgi:replicative DNA helicase
MTDLPGMDILLPPQSKEAEEALIGAALLNPAGLETIGFLNESDFYFGTPRTIWKAIRRLREDKVPIDFLTITDKLDKCGDLEAVGGPANLAGIINNVPMSLNAEAYARIIKDKAQRRSLLTQANSLAKIAYDETCPVGDGVSRVLDNIVNSSQSPDKGIKHIKSGLQELYEYVEMRQKDPSSIWGIKTGFFDFDDYTGGLHEGEVLVIAGPPGSGKSKLSMQMLCQAALPENGNHSVAIYSFEMKQAQVVKRIVSSRQNISTFQMDSGNIPEDVYQNYLGDIEYIESLPIYISDMPMTPQEFHADLARTKSKYGIEAYLLDYLLLMPGYEHLEEKERSGVLSRMIKQTTQTLGLAGVVVSSTTKEFFGSSDIPSMKTVRGSANVVFDADTLTILTPCTEAGRQNITYWTFLKTRTIARSLTKATIELVSDSTYPVFHNAVVKTTNLNWIK